jgi:hypothetical protein
MEKYIIEGEYVVSIGYEIKERHMLKSEVRSLDYYLAREKAEEKLAKDMAFKYGHKVEVMPIGPITIDKNKKNNSGGS